MNEVWLKITDDPITLPPLEVPVFAAGGSLRWPCIMVRSEVYDENALPAWAWCDCDGEPHWDEDKKRWAVWDSTWGDDYHPTHWLAFPDPPEVQR